MVIKLLKVVEIHVRKLYVSLAMAQGNVAFAMGRDILEDMSLILSSVHIVQPAMGEFVVSAMERDIGKMKL